MVGELGSLGGEVDKLEVGRVRASVVVESESQKGILIGKGGTMIRAIWTGARPGIERLLGGQVFLELQVKVRPHWRRDENVLERFGI